MLVCSPLARKTSPFYRRPPLFLEALERRDCPSGPGGLVGLSSTAMPVGSGEVVTLNLAPTGTGMSVVASGALTGATAVSNVQIDLHGEIEGTVLTDANGLFSKTFTAAGLGLVTAQTHDLLSSIASATLAVEGPAISSFSWSESLGLYTFSGTMSSGQFDGMTVVINNGATLNNIKVTVDANGNFTYSTNQINFPADQGIVYVTATDIWGQSDTASTYLS
jgi:hypothetical protein